MPFISKSKYLSGLQCPKLLWTQYNARERLAPPDANTMWIFKQGHEVGALAQAIAPGGVEIRDRAIQRTVEKTAALLERRVPIYEASFSAGDVYCRVDILRPADGGKWDLLEVKSSTKVKDVNLHDIAVQRHCLLSAGLELDRCFLVHINRDYVRRGAVDPNQLLHCEDVSDEVAALAPTIRPRLDAMLGVIDGAEPSVAIGPQCNSPYDCPLMDRCWRHLSADNPTTLVRAGKRAFDWLGNGWLDAADVPDSELSENQRVQAEALRTREVQIDRAAVREWLGTLEYPLLLLDFETFSTAVPILDGTSPYQAIPFQASVHLIASPGAEPMQLEFLATTPEDPRSAMVSFLASLPADGTVLAWHASYERNVIRKLIEEFPSSAVELGEETVNQSSTVELQSLIDRMVDLEDPFRHFDFYHPLQKGSTSIKAVLPALCDLSYRGDAISDGQQASREYIRVMHSDQADLFERDEVLAALREYCKKDTWAMVEVLRVLQQRVGAREL